MKITTGIVDIETDAELNKDTVKYIKEIMEFLYGLKENHLVLWQAYDAIQEDDEEEGYDD